MIVSLLIATYISAATAQAPVKTVTPQLSASPVDEIERILAAPADTLPSRIAEPQALPTVTAAVADSLRSRMPAALDRDSLFNYIPERYTRDPVYDQTLPAEDAWWSSFSDPTLTGLIASGQDYNYNLASALKRIAIARNSLKGIKSAYWPTITASGGWNASHQSSRTTAHLADSPTLTYFSLGLAASWEIDVFGRIAEQAKAGQAQVQMSRAQYDAAMVSVAANIADSYFTLRECQARQQVVREHISQQQEILKMVEVRKETGLASGLDVSQARQVLLTSEAMLTEIKADIRTSLNSLATLTGRFPGSLTQSLINPAALPRLRA